MLAFVKILACFTGVVLLGALLAPPVFWAGQWLVEADLIPQLRGFAFHRYLSRAVMVMAVIAVVPLMRWLGVRNLRDLQLQNNPHRWTDLARGVLIALVGLWSTALVVVWSGRVAFDDDLSSGRVAIRLASALLTGAVVAVIEEGFFRGALFGVMRQRLAWPWALTLLSLLFGIVHFIKPRAAPHVDAVTWTSGFELLPNACERFFDPVLLLSGLVTLVVFGFILGYTVVRTHSLYFAIGLHGGWVFALRSFTKTTHRVGEPDVWLGKTLRIGIVPLLLLAVSGVLIWWLLRRRPTL